jgi:ribosome-associated heat shock protein Hsp15
MAAQAVKGGHVRLNGQRVKTSHDVRVGDELSIARGLVEMDVMVTAVPARRGPAAEAAKCYQETEASRERRRLQAERRSLEREVATVPTRGRPDKRTRRLLRERRLNPGEESDD